MGRRLRVAAAVTVVGICAVGGALLGLRLALQQTPDFYRVAVAAPVAEQEAAGRQFERNVLALHNDLQLSGQWTRVFSAAEINGWLAVDLPSKFPQLLPEAIHDPRVELTPQRLQVAFRYETPQLTTVVSLSLEVQLADEPNTLAVRIRQAQAGWVPLPLKDFLDQLSDAATRADLNLRWAQRDGDPVALITIPRDQDESGSDSFTLQSIVIRNDELVLSGHTGESPTDHGAESAATPESDTSNGQSDTK